MNQLKIHVLLEILRKGDKYSHKMYKDQSDGSMSLLVDLDFIITSLAIIANSESRDA